MEEDSNTVYTSWQADTKQTDKQVCKYSSTGMNIDTLCMNQQMDITITYMVRQMVMELVGPKYNTKTFTLQAILASMVEVFTMWITAVITSKKSEPQLTMSLVSDGCTSSRISLYYLNHLTFTRLTILSLMFVLALFSSPSLLISFIISLMISLTASHYFQ